MGRIRRERGFTLVELMVVVLVIGILVAVAVPVFSAAKTRAQVNTCKANVRTYVSAAQMYYARTGALPTSVSALVGEDLKATPVCPAGGTYTPIGDKSAIVCSVHLAETAYSLQPNDPSINADLVSWFSADYYKGSKADGDVISTWYDKSGRKQNASVAGGALGAKYYASAMNGQPTLRFSGQQGYSIPTVRSDMGGATVLFVSSRDATQTAAQMATNGPYARLFSSATTASLWSAMDYKDGGFHFFGQRTYQHSSEGAPHGPTVYWYSAPSVYLYAPTIGCRSRWTPDVNGFGYCAYGDISEVIIYKRELTAGERTGVMNYLFEKYGTTAALQNGTY